MITINKEKITVREWLRKNNYHDIADLIDELMKEWKQQGKGTRRNWWEILAGNKKGASRMVYGRKFPVIRAAQIRQGIPITPNALCRNEDENIPDIVNNGRWKLKTFDP